MAESKCVNLATMEVDLDQRRSSLTLTETTLEDSRHYQCSVTIPNDDEGNTAATTSLLVLVAPSTPICSIQGTAEYYQDIKLTCLSEEGSPAPVYDWKSYNVENNPRQLPPKDGVLSLFNITRETSGFFTCSSTNRVGSASCTFTLAVMPPSSNTGTIIGIVAGVIAGLVLIAILIYCLRRRKKNKNQAHDERYLLSKKPLEIPFNLETLLFLWLYDF
uniref:Glycoprotein A33 (transmembrane), paralog b n=1 Tax=Salarias fasciatus TaxID=181472 RepID=A0A672IUA7_SALFA